MAITDISRDWGVAPSIVRVMTSDSLATITAPQYLTTQLANIEAIQHGVFQWVSGDVIAIVFNGGSGQFLYDSVNNTFVVNAFQTNTYNSYINNLNLIRGTTTTFSIIPGSARDSTNATDMIVNNELTINATVNGANGLDTGAFAANRFYAVFVIGNSSTANVAGLISLSPATPTLPAGFNVFRRLGYILTNSSTQIIPFIQTGSERVKRMWYLNNFSVLINGTATGATGVALSAAMPNFYTNMPLFSVYTNVTFSVELTPGAAGNAVALRPSGLGSNAFSIISGDAAGIVHIDSIDCPAGYNGNGTMSIDYAVSSGSSVNLFLVAYEDPL